MTRKILVGSVVGVYLGLEADSLVTTARPEVTLNFAGCEGDRHASFTRPADGRTPYYKRGSEMRNDRQVSIVSVEDLGEVAASLNLPEVRAEWLGANLALSGIPKLTLLPPNTRLIFPGGAVLAVTYENMPCTGPGRVIQSQFPDRQGLQSAFPKSALHRRGVVACVERTSLLRAGDEVQVEPAQQTVYES